MNKKSVLLLLVLSTMICGSAVAVDLDSLLKVSAGGEEALVTLQSLKSWEVHGRAYLDGMDARWVEYYAAPDKRYSELIMPGFSLIRACDGETVWRTDMNGRASTVEGYSPDQALADIYMESYRYLFTDSLDKVACYNKIVEKDGKGYHEVAFFPHGSDTLLAYLDTATGLVAITVSKYDNHTYTTGKDDYRSVSGLLFPFHNWSKSDEEGRYEIWVDSVILNTPVDSALFEFPDIKMTDFRFPEGVNQVTLQVKYVDGHIWIPVTLGGHKKVWMVLDTGASCHMLNRWPVEELKYEEVGSFTVSGVGGEADALLLRTDSIQIGGLTLYNHICGAMDLSVFRPPFKDKCPFGGLLGQDFWSRFPILVEYSRSRLTVFNPDSFSVPEGGVEVPFYLTSFIPTITCEVNGVKGDFLVDIGNASGLVLNKPFIEDNQLDKKLSMSLYCRRAFGGIGGFITGRNGYTSRFKMGDVELKSLLCFVPDTAVGMLASEVIAGNIGNKVLDKYRVLLDYQGNRIIYYSWY
jgi:hypothetical protein